MSEQVARRNSVLVGIWRIARGRADGVACFGATPRAFLSSLAPLLAFPIVGTVLAMFSDGPRRALTGLGMTLCALLMPAVLSFELARFWNRSEAWLRYATAFNWCEWILPVLACIAMVPMSLAIGAGVDESSANLALLLCLGLYGLWMQWFLAGKALSLPAARAMLFVILVNVGTFLAVAGPALLAPGS
nr:hypothetical protein [uncultured Rhodopila sp.]